MKVSTLLDHIDSGQMALPEFQRGYVWNREQVRGLMSSLYKRHPVGSLLVWATESDQTTTRGEQGPTRDSIQLLLDGQQRITSLYGIIRGRPPKFFDGNAAAFTNLRFNVETEEFSFYSPVKMGNDPLWVDVTGAMQAGRARLEEFLEPNASTPTFAAGGLKYLSRLLRVQAIEEIDFHIDEITGRDKTINVVVEIFNRVNSGGTKLSKGDLALAKICAETPTARDDMKKALSRWHGNGYDFTLDWLLRSVNTVTTGEAKFHHLHSRAASDFQAGLQRTELVLDGLLNLVGNRLGLDHDRVLFGRHAFPVMARYLSDRGGKLSGLNERDRDKLLYWYLHSSLWGRFSGSTESFIDRDLELLTNTDSGLDKLIAELRVWHGSLRIQPENFSGWSLGARFYPLLYLLTRIGDAKDWGSGLALKEGMMGTMSRLEMHHIFPKAQLYKHSYARADVNAVANFCFLTKDTNLKISDKRPEDYFPEIEKNHPGVLKSQWIPTDPELWKLARYQDFLAARRELLAAAANSFLDSLLHGEAVTEEDEGTPTSDVHPVSDNSVPGGVDSEQEERSLEDLNAWVAARELPPGQIAYELSDSTTGTPLAVLDLAWPGGVQQGLSEPVCVLLNEPPETLAAAGRQGFRFFQTTEEFKMYVERELLVLGETG